MNSDGLNYLDSSAALLVKYIQHCMVDRIYKYFIKVFGDAVSAATEEYLRFVEKTSQQSHKDNPNPVPPKKPNGRMLNQMIFKSVDTSLIRVEVGEYQPAEQERLINLIIEQHPDLNLFVANVYSQIIRHCFQQEIDLNQLTNNSNISNGSMARRLIVETLRHTASMFQSYPTVLDLRASFDEQRDRRHFAFSHIKECIQESIESLLKPSVKQMLINKIENKTTYVQSAAMQPMLPQPPPQAQQRQEHREYYPQSHGPPHGQHGQPHGQIMSDSGHAHRSTHMANPPPLPAPPSASAPIHFPHRAMQIAPVHVRQAQAPPAAQQYVNGMYLPDNEDEIPDDDEESAYMSKPPPQAAPRASVVPRQMAPRRRGSQETTPQFARYEQEQKYLRSSVLPKENPLTRSAVFDPSESTESLEQAQARVVPQPNKFSVDTIKTQLQNFKETNQEMERKLLALEHKQKDEEQRIALELQQKLAEKERQMEQKMSQLLDQQRKKVEQEFNQQRMQEQRIQERRMQEQQQQLQQQFKQAQSAEHQVPLQVITTKAPKAEEKQFDNHFTKMAFPNSSNSFDLNQSSITSTDSQLLNSSQFLQSLQSQDQDQHPGYHGFPVQQQQQQVNEDAKINKMAAKREQSFIVPKQPDQKLLFPVDPVRPQSGFTALDFHERKTGAEMKHMEQVGHELFDFPTSSIKPSLTINTELNNNSTDSLPEPHSASSDESNERSRDASPHAITASGTTTSTGMPEFDLLK